MSLLSLGPILLAVAPLDSPPPALTRIPAWETDFSIGTSAGWKDNLLLTADHHLSSPFLRTTAEASWWRLAANQAPVALYTSFESDLHTASKIVPRETTGLAFLDAKSTPGPHGLQALFRLSYFYQNQVIDASADPTLQQPTVIEGHTTTAEFGLEQPLANPFIASLRFSGQRQILSAPLDPAWEAGPLASLAWTPSKTTEFTLTGQLHRRWFDTKTTTDRSGYPSDPPTTLSLNVASLSLEARQTWGRQQQWRAVVKAGFEHSVDNGAGYHNNDRPLLSAELRWRPKGWEYQAQVRFSDWTYPIQTSDPTSTTLRHRSTLRFRTQVSRSLGSHWRWHAEIERDQSAGNTTGDPYTAHVISSGFLLSF